MTDELKRQYAAALEETALAYFRKRDRIQYESSDMTYLHKFLGGPFRRTDGISPESATKDEPMFSVCSSFYVRCLMGCLPLSAVRLCAASFLSGCR